MAASAPAPVPVPGPDPAKKLDFVYKLFGIMVVLIGFTVWLANTNATANDAKELSKSNAEELKKKADKEDIQNQLQRLEQKLDEINTYLRDKK